MYKQPTLIWYWANWCGHCINMVPEWDKLIKNKNLPVKIKKIQDTEIKNLKIKPIEGFPTIRLYIKNKEIEFNGNRTANDIIKFINDNIKQKGGNNNIYNYIINPKTLKKVKINGRLGKNIIKKYLQYLNN